MQTPLLEGELLDGDENISTSIPSDLIRRRSSVEAPPPRFQLRKQADSNATTPDWFTQRGATDEIREHLKHLGPSNLASRPRQTRYHAVKIKRGSASPSRSAQTDFESTQSTTDSQRQASIGYQGGIGAGLVNPGTEAKDGAHALKIGYGAINSNESVSKSTSSQQFKELPQVSIPESVHEEHEDQPRSSSPHKTSSRTGSVGSTESRSEFIYHHRGPTRSGSITEQVIDVNGIRKVVLHTNGTSSSEEDGKSSSSHTQVSSPRRNDTDTQIDNTDPANSNSNGKKRRRRKRRGQHVKPAGDEPGETQPLLH